MKKKEENQENFKLGDEAIEPIDNNQNIDIVMNIDNNKVDEYKKENEKIENQINIYKDENEKEKMFEIEKKNVKMKNLDGNNEIKEREKDESEDKNNEMEQMNNFEKFDNYDINKDNKMLEKNDINEKLEENKNKKEEEDKYKEKQELIENE